MTIFLYNSTIFRVDLNFRFKTRKEYGILFYAAELSHSDFISLYMKDGHVVFVFDLGNGPAVLRSSRIYNDGLWHNVSTCCST